MFQLRLKDTENSEILNAAENLLPLCRAKNIKFIINDSVSLAQESNADGVHLGSDDGNIAEAREILGAEAIIGASCYNSLELAKSAEKDGASYVGFGAFYATTTKTPKAQAELETLKKWKAASKLPCSAIGGITPQNAAPIIAAGADYICAISYIWNHPVSPEKAIAEFA